MPSRSRTVNRSKFELRRRRRQSPCLPSPSSPQITASPFSLLAQVPPVPLLPHLPADLLLLAQFLSSSPNIRTWARSVITSARDSCAKKPHHAPSPAGLQEPRSSRPDHVLPRPGLLTHVLLSIGEASDLLRGAPRPFSPRSCCQTGAAARAHLLKPRFLQPQILECLYLLQSPRSSCNRTRTAYQQSAAETKQQ